MSNSLFWSEPEWVTEDIIQEAFNKCQLHERVLHGELRQRIFNYDNHLKRRQRKKIGEPLCTRSQVLLYSTLDGTPVAVVHRYIRKNGELGGTGKPDPKRLLLPNRIIAVRQSP